MRIIGLTGGIATGKSTVSQLLAEQGFPVLDADKIAKAVVQQGRWGYRRVVKVFGRDILQPDGEIDRKKLGAIVFSNPELRKQLNWATHPIVTLELIKGLLWHWLLFHWVVVVDVPLLFEGGLHRYASMRMTVACDEDVQLRRLMARDSSEQTAAQARISAQMPLEEKKQRSEIVIDNNGSEEQLKVQVRAAAVKLRAGAWSQGLLSSPAALILGLYWLVTIVRRRLA